jgi:hypothetical protein
MPFWKKSEESQSEESIFDTLFDDDQEFVPYVAPEKVPTVLDASVIAALKAVRDDCELIRDEEMPSWPKFFKNLQTLEANWADLLDAEEVSCPCFADEFFDEEELTTVEWVFNEPKFLNGMAQFIEAEVHFACWLLTSEHRNKLKPAFLTKLFDAIIDSDLGDDCEECGQNLWWGSPLTYLAENINTSSELLKKIYSEVEESDNEVALAALAQNRKTPKSILGELSEDDRKVPMLDDEMCPFRGEASSYEFNIGLMAKASLSTLKA